MQKVTMKPCHDRLNAYEFDTVVVNQVPRKLRYKYSELRQREDSDI